MSLDRAYHILGLGLIIGWLLTWPASLILGVAGLPFPTWALGLCVAFGFGLSMTKVGHVLAAVLGHLSFALVLFALAALTWVAGLELPATPLWAKLVYMVASLVLYASVLGFIRIDIYAWFYNLFPRLVLLVGLVAYAVLFQDIFVGVGTVIGYALYLGRVRANNPLDHLHHLLIPFCVLIGLF